MAEWLEHTQNSNESLDNTDIRWNIKELLRWSLDACKMYIPRQMRNWSSTLLTTCFYGHWYKSACLHVLSAYFTLSSISAVLLLFKNIYIQRLK